MPSIPLSNNPFSPPPTDQFELPSPPTDAISSISYAPFPSSSRLLVSSWDKTVYLYDTHSQPGGELLHAVTHRAPVLDACFGSHEDEIFTAGLDWDVRRIDLPSGTQTVLSSHTAGVKSVIYSAPHSLLISASWDSTLHIHHLATVPPSIMTVALPQKPYALSLSPTRLLVAMAARSLHIYTLASFLPSSQSDTIAPEPWQRRESSLKFLTRAISCMPSDSGYASSSIEGRVAVEYFDPSPESQARKYAFKCHRQTLDADPTQAGDQPLDIVYPVNALAFHPTYGTFASGGGDGVVALWDGVAKRRIRQYARYAASVAGLTWSSDGKFLAVGVCRGVEDGDEDGEMEDGSREGRIFIRELAEGEAVGKGAKR